MSVLIRHWFFWVCLGILSSCSPFRSLKPPVVLVVLESFPETEYLCLDPRKIEGLKALEEECDQFYRFTHVYAPSTLTQPNLSTLFSGREVAEHRVVHNGALGLSSHLKTLAEEAVEFRMRTGFFSGGVPVLQKFGISQGYETFSDGFRFHSQKIFQPMGQTVDQALQWLDREVGPDSFFMTIYAPDLLHAPPVLRGPVDTESPGGDQSKVREVAESIDKLIKGLKDKRRWRNTHFILMGSAGKPQSMTTENPLNGRLLHVPLQIKWARSTAMDGQERRGEKLSFARLSLWLRQLIRHRPSQEKLELSSFEQEKWMSHESHLYSWLGLQSFPALGLRTGQHLFVYNPELKAYDTYVDKTELDALPAEEAQNLAQRYQVNIELKNRYGDFCKFSNQGCSLSRDNQQKIQSLELLSRWSGRLQERGEGEELFSQFIEENARGREPYLESWLAYQLLENKRWAQLFELGVRNKQKAWKLLSRLNLREKLNTPPEGCLSYFSTERKKLEEFYHHCQNSQLRRVIEGLGDLRSRRKPSQGFWAEVARIKARRQARNVNLSTLFINDVEEPFDFSPSLSELYFFLPENQSFLSLLHFDEA